MPSITHNISIISGATERELQVEVEYSVTPGYRGSYIDPPEDASVEITDAKLIGDDGKATPAPWLVEILAEDDDLISECMTACEDRKADAAEARAEAMREDRMFEDY